jgi:hypothetical protein
MILEYSLKCPIAGFEGVTVYYNMMASSRETDVFYANSGKDGSHAKVITRIEGWPLNGTEPFGEDAPLGWRFWASRTGMKQAFNEWLADPDFTTASTPS